MRSLQGSPGAPGPAPLLHLSSRLQAGASLVTVLSCSHMQSYEGTLKPSSGHQVGTSIVACLFPPHFVVERGNENQDFPCWDPPASSGATNRRDRAQTQRWRWANSMVSVSCFHFRFHFVFLEDAQISHLKCLLKQRLIILFSACCSVIALPRHHIRGKQSVLQLCKHIHMVQRQPKTLPVTVFVLQCAKIY